MPQQVRSDHSKNRASVAETRDIQNFRSCSTEVLLDFREDETSDDHETGVGHDEEAEEKETRLLEEISRNLFLKILIKWVQSIHCIIVWAYGANEVLILLKVGHSQNE